MAGQKLTDIATADGVELSEVSRILPLAFLSPSIVDSILAGNQPVSLTAQRLSRLTDLPVMGNSQSSDPSLASASIATMHRAQTFGNKTWPLRRRPELAPEAENRDSLPNVASLSPLSHGNDGAFSETAQKSPK